MDPGFRFDLLRFILIAAVFLLSLIGSFMLQSSWWEAHPASCMPEVEIIIEPDNTISPNCLVVRHYVLIDLVVAALLAFLASRLSRPTDN
jgi:hypothetical protein